MKLDREGMVGIGASLLLLGTGGIPAGNGEPGWICALGMGSLEGNRNVRDWRLSSGPGAGGDGVPG